MGTAEKLADHPLFSASNHAAIVAELQRVPATIRRYDAGRVVVSQGEPCEVCTVLHEGTLTASIESPSGQSLLVETLSAPEILAPALLFADEAVFPVTLTASTDVELVSVTLHAFRRLGHRFPEIYEELLHQVSEKFQFITTKMRLLHFATLRQKIAGYILQRLAGTAGSPIELPYTRDKLAELFGVARPSLSRALGELVSEGVLAVAGRKVEIIRRDNLEQIASEG